MPGKELQHLKAKDNCWICEGWSEHKFELRTPAFDAEVSIHFLFEDFKPFPIAQASAGVYVGHRMLPPGLHQYFYSVNKQIVLNQREQQLLLDS